MADAATAAGRSVSYLGAGTVEFLVDRHENFYFLEMNTRLQVEHPVTEWTLGVDLVAAQLSVAEGQPLPSDWKDLSPRGHAIECRVSAEDPDTYLPRTGTVLAYEEPAGPGIRVDSGIAQGSVVGIDYDPLLAKVIVHAETRTGAIARMRRALRSFVLLGVETNLPLLSRVLESEDFAAGRTDTAFLSRLNPAPPREDPPIAAQIAADRAAESRSAVDRSASSRSDPWRSGGGWRLG